MLLYIFVSWVALKAPFVASPHTPPSVVVVTAVVVPLPITSELPVTQGTVVPGEPSAVVVASTLIAEDAPLRTPCITCHDPAVNVVVCVEPPA